MQKTGVFSVWLGRGSSEDAFHELLEYSIDESGNFRPAPFCRAVGIDEYDPDGFGGRYYSKPLPARLLLRDHRIPSEFVARLDASDVEANCCVALYDEEFQGAPSQTVDGFRFWYLGSFPYEPSVD
jgi:hypothetical protein